MCSWTQTSGLREGVPLPSPSPALAHAPALGRFARCSSWSSPFFVAPDSCSLVVPPWLLLQADQSVATGGLASTRITLLPCLLTPGPLRLCGALRLCAFVFCSARLLPLFLSQPCLAAICFGCLRRSSRLASLEDTVAQGISTCFDAVPVRTVLLLAQPSQTRSRTRSLPLSLSSTSTETRASSTWLGTVQRRRSATGLAVKCCPPAPPENSAILYR